MSSVATIDDLDASGVPQELMERVTALPGKRPAFVLAYAVHGSPTYRNGERSALAATYSARSSKGMASRLLTMVSVKALVLEVDRVTATVVMHTSTVDAAWLLRELVSTYEVTVQDVWEWDDDGGARLRIHELTPDQARAIESIEVETSMEGHGDEREAIRKVKVKLVPKGAQLERIGKHTAVRAFVNSHELEIGDNLADLLRQAKQDRRDREAGRPIEIEVKVSDPQEGT